IIGLGAFTNFGTEANDFSKLFPGIDLRVMTLATNFRVPFFRDILLSLGFVSVSRRSCDNILSQGPGNSCMIVVGGAAEALYAFPGTFDLVIKKRLGFIKVALRQGACLVPVMAFGENDLWDQVPNPKGSLLRKIQQAFQKYMTFSPPLFHGRGMFQYDLGILPHRRPVVSVVGAPIECPKIPHPSEEVVLEYQKKYFDGLQELFDEYKLHWALTSAVVVMTPSRDSSGGDKGPELKIRIQFDRISLPLKGLYRIMGTIAGAVAALMAWLVFPFNPYALAVISILVAVPCFHMFLNSRHPKIGQITLLTFSVVLFGKYATPVDPVTGVEYSIFAIAFRRAIAVGLGVTIGLIVSSYIWPYKARTALRKSLSQTLFRIGLLYSKLIQSFNKSHNENDTSDIKSFLEIELSLSRSLAECSELLKQTDHEPSRGGMLPKKEYAEMIRICGSMVDHFVAMRSGTLGHDFTGIRGFQTSNSDDASNPNVNSRVVGVDGDADHSGPGYVDGDAAVFSRLAGLRSELVGTILLTFYVLSGALSLKLPLPPQLPNAEGPRKRLVKRLRRSFARSGGDYYGGGSREPGHGGNLRMRSEFLYYYAYVLGMDDIIRDLASLGDIMKILFGEISF
ncbi:diacylglycerol O-acyltransferase 1, partial [Quaeritorhiza haematococci]